LVRAVRSRAIAFARQTTTPVDAAREEETLRTTWRGEMEFFVPQNFDDLPFAERAREGALVVRVETGDDDADDASASCDRATHALCECEPECVVSDGDVLSDCFIACRCVKESGEWVRVYG